MTKAKSKKTVFTIVRHYLGILLYRDDQLLQTEGMDNRAVPIWSGLLRALGHKVDHVSVAEEGFWSRGQKSKSLNSNTSLEKLLAEHDAWQADVETQELETARGRVRWLEEKLGRNLKEL